MYPFEFSSTISSELLREFYGSWRQASSLGDILGNIALFVPFGYLGCLVFGDGRRRIPLTLYFSWFTLAMACQVVQLYIPMRSPSFFDVYGNGLGFVIGFAVARVTGGRGTVDFQSGALFENVAFVLLALWAAVRLLPFVPTIDLQSYKDALKPLLLTPHFEWSEFLLLSLSWLVVAWMGKRVLGQRFRSIYFPLCMAVVLILEVIIVNNIITLTDVVSGVMALCLWFGVFRLSEKPQQSLAWLLLSAYVLDTVFPFVASYGPSTFHWLPFTGFLEGSMLINAGSLSEKLFVFGAIFWLLSESQVLSFLKIVVVTLVIFMAEIVQLWSQGRTSELTDPLLVLLIGYLILRLRDDISVSGPTNFAGLDGLTPTTSPAQMKVVSDDGGTQLGQHVVKNYSPSMQVRSDEIDAAKRILLEAGLATEGKPSCGADLSKPTVRSINSSVLSQAQQRKKTLLVSAGASLLIMLFAFIVLRLPGVPYNVRELFLFGGNGVDLFFFSAALLGFGSFSAWMGRWLASSSKPVVHAPLAAMGASIAIYLLFILSVTRESMMDIAGSSVVVHRVGVRGVLGQPGIDFVAMLGPENLRVVTDIFEPVIRFGALIGPVIILLGAIFWVQFRQIPLAGDSSFKRAFAFIGRLFLYLLCMLPWVYFCKVVAFDWSSTDNLNELIARDGSFGWGGGGYLYGLLVLVTLCAGLLAWSSQCGKAYMLKMLLVSVLSVPLAWLLLNAGLSDSVTKYGLEFSGVDFLLGPDRSQHLATMELFWRWTFVYLCMLGGLALGAGLYLHWVRHERGFPDDRRENQNPKPGAVVNKNDTMGLLVNFHQHQIDFLGTLATQMNGTLTATISAIITCLDQEMQGSPSVEAYIYSQTDVDAIIEGADSAMVAQQVYLPVGLMARINDLHSRKGISDSRAVRKLVDSFMLMSQQSIVSSP